MKGLALPVEFFKIEFLANVTIEAPMGSLKKCQPIRSIGNIYTNVLGNFGELVRTTGMFLAWFENFKLSGLNFN